MPGKTMFQSWSGICVHTPGIMLGVRLAGMRLAGSGILDSFLDLRYRVKVGEAGGVGGEEVLNEFNLVDFRKEFPNKTDRVGITIRRNLASPSADQGGEVDGFEGKLTVKQGDY